MSTSAAPVVADASTGAGVHAETGLPELFNYVNGEFVRAQGGGTLPDFDPATGAVAARLPDSSPADVAAAVAAAAAAGPAWAAVTTAARIALLERIADALEAASPALAALEAADAGKTLAMATSTDMPRVVANFRFYARVLGADVTPASVRDGAVNYAARVPLGVVGLVTPWNLPLYLLTWKVAPALACGNTIVAKPSEVTPRSASALAAVLHAAGVPRGVFNLVHGSGPRAGAALVAHPAVRGVSFTGGTATGRAVAALAAPRFAKLSLELGGKNATVIGADVPLERAVAAALRAGYTNNGQICLAGSRVFVQRPLYDAFLPAFGAAVAALRVGPPLAPGVDVGPLSSAAHADKVAGYIALAAAEGGTFLAGGPGAPPGLPPDAAGGYYVRPTAVAGLPPASRVSTEEIFGPVCVVHPWPEGGEDALAAEVNATPYGLSTSIWTGSVDVAHRLAAKIDVGIVWVNTWLNRDLRTPFGGVKESGVGREGGAFSMDWYSEWKNVCVAVAPA